MSFSLLRIFKKKKKKELENFTNHKTLIMLWLLDIRVGIQNSFSQKVYESTFSYQKVRLDRNITNNGRNELEVYNRAQMAASSTNLPLMVHHTNSTIDLGQELPACGRSYFRTTV